MQTVHDGSADSSAASPAPGAQGIREVTRDIDWFRLDWGVPVGTLPSLRVTHREYACEGASFTWLFIEVPKLYLGHKAALLLLQGQSLSRILIPNHEFRAQGVEARASIGHVLLRVDPWEYWRSRPFLTGLQLAHLHEVPAQLKPEEVLSILVTETSA